VGVHTKNQEFEMRFVSLGVALLCLLVCSTGLAADAGADAVVVADAAAAPASAPTIPTTIEEGVDTVKKTVSWFRSHEFRAGIAGVLALLIGLWRKTNKFFIAKVPKKALPWLTAGVAFLATIPFALTVEPWSWKTFVWEGLITGAGAMAWWSMVISNVLPVKKDS
jgi:hypothetical protein